jgi:hypothetical protein
MRLSELRKLVREVMREAVIDKDGLERAGTYLPQTKENPPKKMGEAYTKGQLFGGTIKIGGQPVKVEVELLGADNKKKVFITKVINIDKKYLSKLPSNGILEIPARIFRTPGGGWYKIKTPSVFENDDCGCGCGGVTEGGCNIK